MKKLSRIFPTICLLVLSTFVTAMAQDENWIKKQPSTFRYITAFNDVISAGNVVEQRLIVLMEKEAFNEENLKKLYTLLNKRFSAATGLSAVVFTDMADIPTPEERETGSFLPRKSAYPFAYMFRGKDVSRIEVITNSKDFIIEMPR